MTSKIGTGTAGAARHGSHPHLIWWRQSKQTDFTGRGGVKTDIMPRVGANTKKPSTTSPPSNSIIGYKNQVLTYSPQGGITIQPDCQLIGSNAAPGPPWTALRCSGHRWTCLRCKDNWSVFGRKHVQARLSIIFQSRGLGVAAATQSPPFSHVRPDNVQLLLCIGVVRFNSI